MYFTAPPTRPTVQLRHELPDGSWHIDWMLAVDPRGAAPLVTFRLSRRVDELPRDARLIIQRLPDHRPKYLTYEGPVGGDRGLVQRVARGDLLAWRPLPGQSGWATHVRWPGSAAEQTCIEQVLHLVPSAADPAGGPELWTVCTVGGNLAQ